LRTRRKPRKKKPIQPALSTYFGWRCNIWWLETLMLQIAGYPFAPEQIEDFCRKYGVAEFSLFGSILRDDFGPDSDVDVLVALEPGRTMTPESYLDMRDELSAMFGAREIDLVQKRLLTNPFRRQEILATRKVLYAA
jgi:predicted nucleotidyltransferase